MNQTRILTLFIAIGAALGTGLLTALSNSESALAAIDIGSFELHERVNEL